MADATDAVIELKSYFNEKLLDLKEDILQEKRKRSVTTQKLRYKSNQMQ